MIVKKEREEFEVSPAARNSEIAGSINLIIFLRFIFYLLKKQLRENWEVDKSWRRFPS